MKRIHLLVLLSALALPLAVTSARASGAGSLVVAEVYAAGGNSGAVYANDYVELYNRGASPVAVDGWTLQYASARQHELAVDRTERLDPGRRPLPRAARLRRRERRGAADRRRHRHVEPRGHRRQGGARRRCDRAVLRRLGGKLLVCLRPPGPRRLRERRRLRRERRGTRRNCDKGDGAYRRLHGHRRQRGGLRGGDTRSAELVCRGEHVLGLAASRRLERIGGRRRGHPADALDRARPPDAELPCARCRGRSRARWRSTSR